MTLSVQTSQLCPEFTVCGQISVADVAVFARQGYRSIINNRPDGEGGVPAWPAATAELPFKLVPFTLVRNRKFRTNQVEHCSNWFEIEPIQLSFELV